MSDAIDLGGYETSECLPQLRYRPARSAGEPKWVLQQAFRISVIDTSGNLKGRRVEWLDVPLDPEAR
jgi:hypothetical protein